jgi:hypothetical protein
MYLLLYHSVKATHLHRDTDIYFSNNIYLHCINFQVFLWLSSLLFPLLGLLRSVADIIMHHFKGLYELLLMVDDMLEFF